MREPPLCTLADVTEWDPIKMRTRYTINQVADFNEAMMVDAENRRRLEKPK